MFGRKPDRFAAVPHKVWPKVLLAQQRGEAPVFHGGCRDCFFQPTCGTPEGLLHCTGCRYITANWDLPDKGRHSYDYRAQIESLAYRDPRPTAPSLLDLPEDQVRITVPRRPVRSLMRFLGRKLVDMGEKLS